MFCLILRYASTSNHWNLVALSFFFFFWPKITYTCHLWIKHHNSLTSQWSIIITHNTHSVLSMTLHLIASKHMIGSFTCHIRIALLSSASAYGKKAGRPNPNQQTAATDGLKSICNYPPITSCSSYASLTMGQLVVSAGCGVWTAAGESLCSAMMLLRESLSLAHLTHRCLRCCCCCCWITTACDEHIRRETTRILLQRRLSSWIFISTRWYHDSVACGY